MGAAVQNGTFPLSPAQVRQWVAGRFTTDPPDHVVLSWRIRGGLDRAALRRSLTALVRRHPALRLRFAPQQALPPLQWISADAGYELLLPGAEPEGGAGHEGAAGDGALRPFDLAAGPLVRAQVTEADDGTAELTLTVPRIVCDPHSAGVLSTDLAALYRSALDGSPDPAPPAAFAHRPPPESGSPSPHLAYWHARLADVPAAELPADLPRPAIHTQRQRTVSLRVPREPVRRLCAEHPEGIGVFTVFAAGLAALLARYSRSGDVALATHTPLSGRAGDAQPVGCNAGLLPLRVDASDDPSLATLVARVRSAAQEADGHADVPFADLVTALAPDRDPGSHPLVQAALDIVPLGPGGPAGPGLRPQLAPPVRSPFDVYVTVADPGGDAADGGGTGGPGGVSAADGTGDDDAYAVAFSCAAGLFGDEAADRTAGHFARLLADALAHPDRPLSRLALLSEAERHEVLAPADGPRPAQEATVVALFARQVAAAPGATALWSPPDVRTYADLDAESDRLAGQLAKRGVGADDRVAVLLPRAPEQVVALLAVLKAGAAYVPLDPAHPAERTGFVLRDSGARLLLTDRRLGAGYTGDLERLLVDAPDDGPRGEAAGPPPGPASPDGLAYVIYTSGSTGTPKGVAVTHRCVVHLVSGLGLIPAGPGDTLLMLAPTAFDASTFEVWHALCNGARLAVYPPGPVGPLELGKELERLEVTTLWLTAQLANLVADVRPQALAGLRTLVVGGEALSVPHLRALRDAAPRLRIVNGYGPTETTTFATNHLVLAEDLDAPTGVPIGRPIGGTRAYVVDRAGNPVPAGVVGELLIGGAGVARGYLGRPAMTAERFVPDPFGPPGGRLYRTGDLAQRLPDGTIAFVGRADDQVKLRGFRIEPGEVRATLTAHPAVRDAFVTVRGTGMAAALVAYVVPAGPGGADPGELRAHLLGRLPEPLIPSRFVPLERLPLTANGKVDRRALPDPTRGPGPRSADRAPATAWETAVGDVWTAVLGRAPAGVHDDFFALGGSSLALLEVAAALTAAYGTAPDPRTLLRLRTVAGLAGWLAAHATAPVSASDHR
ncbi:MAG: amino acid adenylation domain-containing protein [Streptomyces sp.]|nr:amino acid adenylation domain-containing protein [Streptomyces sp.]